jgi:hypothetical protein
VPVVYTDVLSMYPTVNALMGLWRLHVAERVEVEDCTEDARAVLAGVTAESILDPATWPRLAFFGQIVPDGDVLPVRAQYGGGWRRLEHRRQSVHRRRPALVRRAGPGRLRADDRQDAGDAAGVAAGRRRDAARPSAGRAAGGGAG